MESDGSSCDLNNSQHFFLSAGWRYGERMRDGDRGWFPASCTTQITDLTTLESNVKRMERLRKETDV